MAITKTPNKALKDSSIETNQIENSAVTNAKLDTDAVTSAKIQNGQVTADDLASTLDLSSKTVTLPSGTVDFSKEYFNISLLGFKMAVNESLTVFNLLDGVVDEFQDESGTDESEGSNDTYNATDDYYINSTQPDGASVSLSAGFSGTMTVTEPDTSTAGQAGGAYAQYSVSTCSVNLYLWGSAGGVAPAGPPGCNSRGAAGGFSSGTLAVSPGQTLYINAGEGGAAPGSSGGYQGGGNGAGGMSGPAAGGGGLSIIASSGTASDYTAPQPAPARTPSIYMIAGAGGAGAGRGWFGGGGGGLQGNAEGNVEQTNYSGQAGGGGGSQTQGGQGGPVAQGGGGAGQTGGFLFGGAGGSNGGGGAGSGFYGGGGGGGGPQTTRGGGGGSGYVGHPQISSGTSEDGGNAHGGASDPLYSCTSGTGRTEAGAHPATPGGIPQTVADGYAFITACQAATATSTTIISTAFSATSVPTTSRIVVFEENIDTPTLNTDIIASVSRDGGSNYTSATLSDSGYVTGSSGQRILTGQADISGQPSGQSMRWKLALANNQVKIHGVSLSWS